MRRFIRSFAPTAGLLPLPLVFLGPSAGAQKVAPLEKRRVAANGMFADGRKSLRVVTWQTANPPGGSLPYARAHLTIETSGSPRRTLFEADGGDSQYLVNSVQVIRF